MVTPTHLKWSGNSADIYRFLISNTFHLLTMLRAGFLLQELLMALRANDVDGNKCWLALGIEELGRDIAAEVESEWMVLFEESREPNCVFTGLTIETGSSLNQQQHYFLEIMILSN